MKYKIYSNKKAIGIDDAVPLIIFLVIAAFVIVFFRINEKITSNRIANDIEAQKEILDGDNVLVNYLRGFDDKGNTNADLLSKSFMKNYYDDVKKSMQAYFDKELSNIQAWHIDVTTKSNEFFVESTDYQLTQPKDEIAIAIIPAIGKESQYIQLVLYFGKNPTI